jgi:hypothetical protein
MLDDSRCWMGVARDGDLTQRQLREREAERQQREREAERQQLEREAERQLREREAQRQQWCWEFNAWSPLLLASKTPGNTALSSRIARIHPRNRRNKLAQVGMGLECSVHLSVKSLE